MELVPAAACCCCCCCCCAGQGKERRFGSARPAGRRASQRAAMTTSIMVSPPEIGRRSAEQRTDHAAKGTDNAAKGTDNAAKGTDNASKGTDNAVKGTDKQSEATCPRTEGPHLRRLSVACAASACPARMLPHTHAHPMSRLASAPDPTAEGQCYPAAGPVPGAELCFSAWCNASRPRPRTIRTISSFTYTLSSALPPQPCRRQCIARHASPRCIARHVSAPPPQARALPPPQALGDAVAAPCGCCGHATDEGSGVGGGGA